MQINTEIVYMRIWWNNVYFLFQAKYDINCGVVLFWLILCIKRFLVISCAESQLQLSSDIQAVIRICWVFQGLSLSTVIIIHLQQLQKHKTRVVYISSSAAY